jgi:thioredoxin-related protein
MRLNRTQTMAAALVWLLIFPALSGADSPVNWYAYKEGRALGEEQGKKVFLYFRSDNCPYCNQMEKETLGAPKVARFLNRNFISVRIDVDKNPSLSSRYRVVGLPTSYFIDGEGGRIGGIPGYQPADRFLSFLRYLDTDSYREMSFAEFTRK